MQPAMFHPNSIAPDMYHDGTRKTRLGLSASIIAALFAASNLIRTSCGR